MNCVKIISWTLAALPLFCVFYLLLEVSEAFLHFGHFPKYPADPDPFHTSWKSVFPEAGLFIYFLLPLFLLPALLILAVRPLRYSGEKKLLFYLLVACSVIATWFFIFADITGFINWRLD
jgi:hypothetical protein